MSPSMNQAMNQAMNQTLKRAGLAILVFSGVFISRAAHAEVTADCRIAASMELIAVHWWGVGGSKGEGSGLVTCAYSDGTDESFLIGIKVWGIGVGWGISKTNVSLEAPNVRFTGRASRKLIGTFVMTRSGASGGEQGTGKDLSFEVTKDSFRIPFKVKIEDGTGFELAANLGNMEIFRP